MACGYTALRWLRLREFIWNCCREFNGDAFSTPLWRRIRRKIVRHRGMGTGMGEDREADAGASLAAYVATLFPTQQHAIATAQLAGCRFERRSVERYVGWRHTGWRHTGPKKWIDTTVYDAFLPDGQMAGTFEDIYESAVVCLSILDTPHGAPRRGEIASGAFALLPENDLGETN